MAFGRNLRSAWEFLGFGNLMTFKYMKGDLEKAWIWDWRWEMEWTLD